MKQGIAHYIETEERNRKHTLSYDAEFASDNDNGDSLKSFADSLEDKRAYDEILDHVENVSLTMKLKNAPNLTRVLTEYVLAYAELHPEIYELNVSSARSLIRSVLKEDIALTDNMIRDYFRSMKELIYAED
jgi:hypothetical protein